MSVEYMDSDGDGINDADDSDDDNDGVDDDGKDVIQKIEIPFNIKIGIENVTFFVKHQKKVFISC